MKKHKGIYPVLCKFNKLSYDGKYPNLCSGNLKISIGSKEWEFPPRCLRSGGNVSFDEDWNENVDSGEWSIENWPDGFPEDWKEEVLHQINLQIPWGCCGGCV